VTEHWGTTVCGVPLTSVGSVTEVACLGVTVTGLQTAKNVLVPFPVSVAVCVITPSTLVAAVRAVFAMKTSAICEKKRDPGAQLLLVLTEQPLSMGTRKRAVSYRRVRNCQRSSRN